MALTVTVDRESLPLRSARRIARLFPGVLGLLCAPGLAGPAAAEECWRTLSPTTTLPGHKDKIASVAISPDGSLVASGDRRGEVRLWDVARRRLRGQIRAPSHSGHGGHGGHGAGTVDALSFGAAGKLLLVGWRDGTLRVGSPTAGDPGRVFTETGAVALAPGGELLLGGSEGLLSPWSGKPVRAFPGVGGDSLAFSADGALLAVGQSGQVELRSGQDGRPLGSAPLGTPAAGEKPGPVGVVTFSPDGKWLAATQPERSMTYVYTLFNPEKPALIRSLNTTQFAFLPDARFAYAEPTSAAAERIAIIELPHSPWKTCLVAPPAGNGSGFAPAALAASPSGQWLTASDHALSRVHIWNLKPLSAPPEPEPLNEEIVE